MEQEEKPGRKILSSEETYRSWPQEHRKAHFDEKRTVHVNATQPNVTNSPKMKAPLQRQNGTKFEKIKEGGNESPSFNPMNENEGHEEEVLPEEDIKPLSWFLEDKDFSDEEVEEKGEKEEKVKEKKPKKEKKEKKPREKKPREKKIEINEKEEKEKENESEEDIEEAKRLNVRRNLMQEVLGTEGSYVRGLRNMISEFRDPLIKMALITETEVKYIFGNIEAILALHERFLAMLQQFILVWDPRQPVSFAFAPLLIKEFFEFYGAFISNQSRSEQLFTEICQDEKRKKFVEFVNSRDDLQRNTFLSFSSLNISPIQRLPRYELLLREFLKYMNTNDPDYPALKLIFDQVQSLTSKINKRKANVDRLFGVSQPRKTFYWHDFKCGRWSKCDFCDVGFSGWGFSKNSFKCKLCGAYAHPTCAFDHQKFKECTGQKQEKESK